MFVLRRRVRQVAAATMFLLIVAIAGAGIACGGGSKSSATVTPPDTGTSLPVETATTGATESATATPPAGTTPSPAALPSTIAGKPVTELAPGDPVGFPENTVLYVATSACANCGFAPGDLWRIYADHEGKLMADHAEPPGNASVFSISPDGSTIIAGVCNTYCGGESFPYDDAVLQFAISRDGGVTWQPLPNRFERTEVWLTNWHDGELLATAIHFLPGNTISQVESFLLPSFTPLVPPAALPSAALDKFQFPVPRVGPSGDLVWTMRQDGPTDRLFDANGKPTSFASAGLSADFGWSLRGTDVTTGHQLWQAYGEGAASFFAELDARHQAIAGYASTTPMSPHVAVAGGLWFGAAIVPLAPGEAAIDGNDNYRAVLIDRATGLLHPVNGLPRSESPLPGKFSWPVLAMSGDYWRVASGGACLDVHAEASAESASLGCFASGVLLRACDESAPEGWLAVTAPGGKAGFAERSSLR